jgi:hypothetical protein
VRLLRGLSELQVAQLQPTTGVPALEPTPSIVSCMLIHRLGVFK